MMGICFAAFRLPPVCNGRQPEDIFIIERVKGEPGAK